jgi:hypothetical protein
MQIDLSIQEMGLIRAMIEQTQFKGKNVMRMLLDLDKKLKDAIENGSKGPS